MHRWLSLIPHPLRICSTSRRDSSACAVKLELVSRQSLRDARIQEPYSRRAHSTFGWSERGYCTQCVKSSSSKAITTWRNSNQRPEVSRISQAKSILYKDCQRQYPLFFANDFRVRARGMESTSDGEDSDEDQSRPFGLKIGGVQDLH